MKSYLSSILVCFLIVSCGGKSGGKSGDNGKAKANKSKTNVENENSDTSENVVSETLSQETTSNSKVYLSTTTPSVNFPITCGSEKNLGSYGVIISSGSEVGLPLDNYGEYLDGSLQKMGPEYKIIKCSTDEKLDKESNLVNSSLQNKIEVIKLESGNVIHRIVKSSERGSELVSISCSDTTEETFRWSYPTIALRIGSKAIFVKDLNYYKPHYKITKKELTDKEKQYLSVECLNLDPII